VNRLVLKYATPLTLAILAIFAWVTYRRVMAGGLGSITLMAATTVAVWVIGTFAFIYFWPRITVGGFKRIFVRRGLGGGPIPVTQFTLCRRAHPSPLDPAA